MKLPTTPCQGCGKPIVFCKTKAGMQMPIDEKAYTLFIVREPIEPGAPPTCEGVQVHASHFSTCPQAAEFRRTR